MKSQYEENLIRITPRTDYMEKFRVTKTDDFVKMVPYPKLSVIQWKILYYLISMVEPDDERFKDVEFDAYTFAKLFGMPDKSASNIRKAILGLRGNPVFALIDEEKKASIAMVWCHVYIEETNNIVRLRLDEDLERYFLNIDKHKGYISYPLTHVFNFKCKYSFWFYDQFILGGNFGRVLTVDYIRKQLGLTENYQTKLIKSRIVAPAIEDINKNGLMKVTYAPVIKGKKIQGFKFTITRFRNEEDKKYQLEERDKFADLHELDAAEDNFLTKGIQEVKLGDTRYVEIMEHLNKQCDTSYDIEDYNSRRLIEGWLNKGYTVADFVFAIDNQWLLWHNNDQFKKYLCPETLFGPKFPKYAKYNI